MIRVGYISETSFCEEPLIKPKAPIAFTINVKTNKITLIHDFVLSFRIERY